MKIKIPQTITHTPGKKQAKKAYSSYAKVHAKPHKPGIRDNGRADVKLKDFS